MTVLDYRILLGQEDNRLLEIINSLGGIKNLQDGGNGLSPREKETLTAAYIRLDRITDPG